jgi:aldehyde:ferredoxin oxidoreductase
MDKILRINMGADGGPAVNTEPVGDYAGFGGRGLTSAIVSKEVPPLCHPLGEDNKLVIAPGLLSGSTAAMSGRISVGCKSPLTGGIKEANSGGQASQMLGRLGYAAIVLEGQPKENNLYRIFINKDGVDIKKDNSLYMLGNYDTVEKVKAEYGEKISCISIGQAGEMKMSGASIAFTDMELRPTRHAGRGGVGAVMGSKGVKIIVIDDAGMKARSPQDPDKFRDANKAFVAGLRKHAVTGEALPAYGTNVLANIINEAGAYPTPSKISGETQAETENARGGEGSATHGCHRGCVIRCSGTFYDKNGNFLTKQPEYETVWAHGANCGIDDLDAIAQIDRMDDDFGLDTIEMGATIAVAMEAGLAEFGDAEARQSIRRGESAGRQGPGHAGL